MQLLLGRLRLIGTCVQSRGRWDCAECFNDPSRRYWWLFCFSCFCAFQTVLNTETSAVDGVFKFAAQSLRASSRSAHPRGRLHRRPDGSLFRPMRNAAAFCSLRCICGFRCLWE
ncbi:hypothetical protein DQ04_05571030 [Trypanosoma grayi]|uniref:hypothetical protein n=1 Tax=Trypanosoma grayi TaxID=71804 RepID=UPI0004F4B02B|nr:hypothetical protein DQ04_05571030 [Trypanosoma grayi]KEG09231.1 hypothetical protein DQ04_05571030 [Trypanosoma grayi]